MKNGSSRRSFFKLMAAAPLLSQIAARDLYASAAKTVGGGKENIYARLGVKTIINCRGTWTYLSGSLNSQRFARRNSKPRIISSTCWTCSGPSDAA